MEPVETLVNSRVRRLAEYLEIDPKVAQELYYQSGLWNSIDGLEHKARKEELGNLRSLRKALAKHSPKFEHQDVIQTTFRIDGFNLKKTLAHLEEQLDLMVGLVRRAMVANHMGVGLVATDIAQDTACDGQPVTRLELSDPLVPHRIALARAPHPHTAPLVAAFQDHVASAFNP